MSAAPEKKPKPTFNGLREALSLPAPAAGQPFLEYRSQEFAGFKMRVHPPDSAGRVLRQWAIRVKYTVGGKQKEDRSTFGQLEAFSKAETAVGYKDARDEYLRRVNAVEKLRSAPEEADAQAKRMTVADVWARHEVATRTQREATTTKEKGQYARYFKHLAERWLDELDYDYWARFLDGLGKGKLLNADGLTWTQLDTPLAEATVVGIMNLAGKLFSIAQRHKGLRGMDKDANPALDAKRDLAGTPNKRSGYIPLNRVAEVWRAADPLCASWARDQLRMYLLTGLRHSLVAELMFPEVDSRSQVLRLSPHKPGTKRRGARTPAKAPDIVLPICATVVNIIQARQPWAPDQSGFVWYSVVQPGGKRPAKDAKPKAPRYSDPRSNWAHLEKHVLDGMHFMRHDLRRTFANIAVAAGADLMGTSLLMLHSPRTVAKVLGLPDVTLDYMNTAEARGKMRSASNAIERYVLGLLDGSITPPSHEPDLPPELEEAVGAPDDE